MKDRAKIVIPKPARSKIIAELHRAHSGINKTYTTARQLYYWPNMKNDKEQSIAPCSLCQANRTMQARPMASGTNPSSVKRPMDEIGTDLFDAIGKKWLATVDRYSGYAWLAQLQETHTAKIAKELSNIFNSFGWPNSIRTDGGPQFRQEFAKFCKTNSIQHKLASAHNPESNGLAEAAVKNLKAIVTRTRAEKANLEEPIAAWRNMGRVDGISPSQLFFNRLPHQKLPIHADPTPINIKNRSRSKTHSQNVRIKIHTPKKSKAHPWEPRSGYSTTKQRNGIGWLRS